MTAAVLAKQMMAGLSQTALTELHDTLKALSQGGFGDVSTVFGKLLDGQEMSAALGLPEGTAALLYAQAHARFNNGHVEDALALFQALTVLAPSGKDHWLGLGICLRLSGVFAGARLAFATALELEPQCPAATYHLAELAFAQGQLSEAGALLVAFSGLPETATKQNLAAEARRLGAVLGARR